MADWRSSSTCTTSRTRLASAVGPVLPAVLRRGVLLPSASFDRSSLTRWRQRMDKLVALIQESLPRTRMGAANRDFRQCHRHDRAGEAIAFPTTPTDASRTRAPGAPRPSEGRNPAPIVRAWRHRADQAPGYAQPAVQAADPPCSIRTMLGRVIRDVAQDRRPTELATCSRCRSRARRVRISASASAAGSSTRCMLLRSSALAKARPTNPMSRRNRQALQLGTLSPLEEGQKPGLPRPAQQHQLVRAECPEPFRILAGPGCKHSHGITSATIRLRPFSIATLRRLAH